MFWIRFPSDVRGWLSIAEGYTLAELAQDKLVLEIGSFKGRSTICMAQTAARVHCLDPFDKTVEQYELDSFPEFRANIRRYGVHHWVTPHIGLDRHIQPILAPVFDLIFIDGDHSFEAAIYNLDMAEKLLKPGGRIAVHDYQQPLTPYVTAAIHVWLKDKPEWIRDCLVDTLLVLKKKE